MADEPSGFTSAFDKLLEQNREQFDRILSTPASSRAATTSSPVSGSGSGLAPRKRYGPLDAERSAAVQALDQRFGAEGWRYEITERRRVEGELIVLCRVTLAGRSITKSQFGSAPLAEPGIAAEEAALAQAAEMALSSCTKLI
ncbi:MAG: hypothetical protein RIM84_23540 [Alphaproteobacteria bacterium]